MTAVCIACGAEITEFSKAHLLNREEAKSAADERYIHCKCNGCTKNEFGDYTCRRL